MVGLALTIGGVIGVAPAAAQTEVLRVTVGLAYYNQKIDLGSERVTASGQGIELEGSLLPPVGSEYVEVHGRWSPTRTLSSADGRVTTEVASVDARVGHRYVKAQVGYGGRSVSGAFSGQGVRKWSFLRLGGYVTVPLGVSGLTVAVAGSRYVNVSGGGRGREAEWRLTYDWESGTWRSAPHIFAGYRFSEFTDEGPAGARPERTASFAAGVGVRFPPGGG